MKVTDALLVRSNRWLAENTEGGTDKEAWEAATAVLEMASHEELGSALREILEAAKGHDGDAKNIVTSFGRFHPPQSLSNPRRQRELIGLYLLFRQGGLWDTSDDLGNPDWEDELRQILK